MCEPPLSRRTRRRGVTLVLTLLLVAVLSLVLARQALRVGTARMTTLAQSFSLESEWVAQGAAEQWLARARAPDVDWAILTSRTEWRIGDVSVEVRASATEHKLCVRTVPPQHWLAAWRREPASADVLLVEDPQRTLMDSGFTAVECLLDRRHATDREAYIAPTGGVALAELLTVWGDGKVDLNRAPRDVLAAALHGFTDAQLSGLLRLREREPLDSLDRAALKLGLSGEQREMLLKSGVFAPRHMEMLITVKRGGLSALYHAVVDAEGVGRVLEMRLIH